MDHRLWAAPSHEAEVRVASAIYGKCLPQHNANLHGLVLSSQLKLASKRMCCNTILQRETPVLSISSAQVAWDASRLMHVCRYHYNVSTDRLMSHVKKGWDQNLRISSATSNNNLWAVVMDQSTGYTKQSYKVGPSFLPKSWCLEQWDAGFYITAVAGAEQHTLCWQLSPCSSSSC